MYFGLSRAIPLGSFLHWPRRLEAVRSKRVSVFLAAESEGKRRDLKRCRHSTKIPFIGTALGPKPDITSSKMIGFDQLKSQKLKTFRRVDVSGRQQAAFSAKSEYQMRRRCNCVRLPVFSDFRKSETLSRTDRRRLRGTGLLSNCIEEKKQSILSYRWQSETSPLSHPKSGVTLLNQAVVENATESRYPINVMCVIRVNRGLGCARDEIFHATIRRFVLVNGADRFETRLGKLLSIRVSRCVVVAVCVRLAENCCVPRTTTAAPRESAVCSGQHRNRT